MTEEQLNDEIIREQQIMKRYQEKRQVYYEKYALLDDCEKELARAFLCSRDTDQLERSMNETMMNAEYVMSQDVIPHYCTLLKYDDYNEIMTRLIQKNNDFGGEERNSTMRQYAKEIERMKSGISEIIEKCNFEIEYCAERIAIFKRQLYNE